MVVDEWSRKDAVATDMCSCRLRGQMDRRFAAMIRQGCRCVKRGSKYRSDQG